MEARVYYIQEVMEKFEHRITRKGDDDHDLDYVIFVNRLSIASGIVTMYYPEDNAAYSVRFEIPIDQEKSEEYRKYGTIPYQNRMVFRQIDGGQAKVGHMHLEGKMRSNAEHLARGTILFNPYRI